jgi:hypothetical protein
LCTGLEARGETKGSSRKSISRMRKVIRSEVRGGPGWPESVWAAETGGLV